MQSGTFRQRAFDHLSSPEQLDQIMKIVKPQSWLALTAFTLVAIAALAWGILGSIPEDIKAKGLLLHPPGIARVFATNSGLLQDLTVDINDSVSQGQVVARVRSADGTLVPLAAPISGKIFTIVEANESYVTPGTRILSIEPDTPEVQAVIYVNSDVAKDLRPGLTVNLSVPALDPSTYGTLVGRVSFVSEFPASPERQQLIYAVQSVNQTLTNGAPVNEVRVDLIPDPANPSGFKWSSGRGPAVPITSGTIASADIILKQERPLGFVFPIFDR